jgi:hypothetical protein
MISPQWFNTADQPIAIEEVIVGAFARFAGLEGDAAGSSQHGVADSRHSRPSRERWLAFLGRK